MRTILSAFPVALLAAPASAATIDWATVGSAGNAADPAAGYGPVAFTCKTSKYDAANARYAHGTSHPP